MQNADPRFRTPVLLILIGACMFVVALAVSAYWESDIRWLHFFQAWMYIAAMVLSFRGSQWGHFIGVSAAGLWDYMTIFANPFFLNGLQQLSQWVHTGRLARPDVLIAVPAWLSNLLVVVACLWAYWGLPVQRQSDIFRLLVAFTLTTGFFAADMAVFQPRYLALFPRMLHPHWP